MGFFGFRFVGILMGGAVVLVVLWWLGLSLGLFNFFFGLCNMYS